MTALAYLRRSKESDARTVSLDVQRAAVAAYCRTVALEVVGEIEDDGVSGGKRARFGRINAGIQAAGARAVVAYHLDRLARDTAGVLDWMEDLTRRGIAVHVCGRGEVEATSAAGRLTVGVEALVADHYRRVIAEKTRDALARLRAQGRRTSRFPPYGARLAQDGMLAPDPSEQATVARIGALRAAGLSVRRIARQLVREGVPARSGRPWQPTVVARLIRRGIS